MKNLCIIFLFIGFNLNISAQYAWRNIYSAWYYSDVNSVDTTSDQGYFITGTVSEYHAADSYSFAAKLDSNGNEIWQIIGDGTGTCMCQSYGNCIINTGDGGCLIGGVILKNTNDLYFIRLDSAGHFVWKKNYSRNNDLEMGSMIKVGNNYICTYGTYSTSFQNYLFALNDQGDSLWSKSLDIKMSFYSSSSLIITANNNIAVIGNVKDSLNNNMYDLAFSELDTLGNLLYTRTYPDTVNFFGLTINQTVDGGFLLSSFNSLGMSKIIKVDSTGMIKWKKVYSNTNSCVSSSLKDNRSVISLRISGNSLINILLLDSLGNSILNDTIVIDTITAGFYETRIIDNIIDRNGSLIISGDITRSGSGPSYGFVLKKNFDNTNSTNDFFLKEKRKIRIFPNHCCPGKIK